MPFNQLLWSFPPPFIRSLTGLWLTWDKPPGGKRIYLTFDDGPDPDVTPAVIEILEGFNARATFFLTGRKAGQEPHLVTQLRESGHALGNHGFDHLRGFFTPARKYIADLERCASLVPSRLFRPPYGSLTPSLVRRLRQMGYEICMWTVSSRDYSTRVSPTTCLQQSIRYTRDGSIVLFHDTGKSAKNCLYTLPRFLDHFSGLGYSFPALEMPKPR